MTITLVLNFSFPLPSIAMSGGGGGTLWSSVAAPSVRELRRQHLLVSGGGRIFS
jgi:hypothetical protein